MKTTTKIILFLFILLAGVISAYHLKKKLLLKKEAARKEFIAQESKKIFNNCEDLTSFEKRRSCFESRLIEMKSKNQNINKSFIFEIDNIEYSAENEDDGSLVKIKRPKGYAFIKCSSSTFFFDWTEDFFYLSQENFSGAVFCETNTHKSFYILPKNLKKEEKQAIKSFFSTPVF